MFSKLATRTTLLGVALAAATFGCSDDDTTTAPVADPAGTTFVRVAHLSPDAPDVDVWVDGNVALAGVEFRDFSGYLELEEGSHRIQVTPAGDSEPVVIDAVVSLDEGVYTTVAATGVLAEIEPIVLADDLSRDASMAKVRFVHAGPDAPDVDITLTDGTVLFGDVEFQESTTFANVAAASYDLQVRLAGTDVVALSFADVALSSNMNYTIFATGLLADGSLEATVTIDSPGSGDAVIEIEPAMSSVRVAHMSPDAPDVDIYVDGDMVSGLVGVPFKAVSGYLSLGASTHNVQVFVTGTSSNPVIDADVTLLPDSRVTIAATGLVMNDDLHPVVLDDRGAAGNSLVRFVHFSPDAPEVDIVVASGPTLFNGIGFRSSAGYNEVAPGTYDLEVRLSENGGLALSLPGVEIVDKVTYTVFAVGLAGNGTLEAVQVEDGR